MDSMPNETINRIIDAKVGNADVLKIQTAEALEEAARKLRMADVSAKGGQVKQILQDGQIAWVNIIKN